MSIKAPVGTTINLVVDERKLSGKTVISFSPDFVDCDSLLPDHPDDHHWHHPWNSMRLYHLDGEGTLLRRGDEWECRITDCWHNPRDSRTKDGRRKIHFKVTPIKKIERTEMKMCWLTGHRMTIVFSGSNRDVIEEQMLMITKKTYRTSDDQYVIDVAEGSLDGETVERKVEVTSMDQHVIRRFYTPENIQTQPVLRFLAQRLEVVPPELVQHVADATSRAA